MRYFADCAVQNYLFYEPKNPNRMIWSVEKKLNSDPTIGRADNRSTHKYICIYAVKRLHTLVKKMFQWFLQLSFFLCSMAS